MKIKEITQEEMVKVIENRKPEGLFYRYDKKDRVYIGVDNSTGDAWTEEFETLEGVIAFLEDDEEFDSISFGEFCPHCLACI